MDTLPFGPEDWVQSILVIDVIPMQLNCIVFLTQVAAIGSIKTVLHREQASQKLFLIVDAN